MMSIVQDVEVAEALLDSYLAALGHVDAASAVFRGGQARLEQEAVIGTIEQTYPEIWRRLDAARAAAVQSGRDIPYYDQMRAYAGTFGVTAALKLPRAVVAEGNLDGARAARDAIAAFRATFPELAWHSASEPVPELRSGRKTAKVISIVGGLLVAALAFAIYTQL
jgi:hypothetical protein